MVARSWIHSLFTFTTLCPGSFHGLGALRAKRTSGPPTGYLTDGNPPAGNAVVYSSLSKCHFYRPLHVLVLEIPYSCFDLPVCQPAGSHCPRSPQPECGRPVVDTPVPPHPTVTVVLATPFPPNPMVDSLIGATPRTPTPVLNI